MSPQEASAIAQAVGLLAFAATAFAWTFVEKRPHWSVPAWTSFAANVVAAVLVYWVLRS